jgi:hypothetical protein
VEDAIEFLSCDWIVVFLLAPCQFVMHLAFGLLGEAHGHGCGFFLVCAAESEAEREDCEPSDGRVVGGQGMPILRLFRGVCLSGAFVDRAREQGLLLEPPGGELGVLSVEFDADAPSAETPCDMGCRSRAKKGIENATRDWFVVVVAAGTPAGRRRLLRGGPVL